MVKRVHTGRYRSPLQHSDFSTLYIFFSLGQQFGIPIDLVYLFCGCQRHTSHQPMLWFHLCYQETTGRPWKVHCSSTCNDECAIVSLWIGTLKHDFKHCVRCDINKLPDLSQRRAYGRHVAQLFPRVTQVSSIMLCHFNESHRTNDWFKGHSHDHNWFDWTLIITSWQRHQPLDFGFSPSAVRGSWLQSVGSGGHDCNETERGSRAKKIENNFSLEW